MRKLGLPILAVLLGLLLGTSGAVAVGFAIIPNGGGSQALSDLLFVGRRSAANPFLNNRESSDTIHRETPRPADQAGRATARGLQHPSADASGVGGNRLAVKAPDPSSFVQWSREIPSTLSVGACGDLNGDAEVDVFDAIVLLQIVVELVQPTPNQEILGDLNRDGTIAVVDAIMALQHIVGLIPTLDVCGPLASEQ